MAGFLVAAAVIAVAAIYYYRVDPADGGVPCMFKLITGYDCPGCGTQRALHAVLHGDISGAWHFNPMIFFAIPAAVCFLIVEACPGRFRRFHNAMTKPVVPISMFILITAYWIGRNIDLN